MNEQKGKTVASISFHDNRSLSLDVEKVSHIELGPVIEVGDGENWFVELMVRSDNGVIALQLLSDDPGKLIVNLPSAGE